MNIKVVVGIDRYDATNQCLLEKTRIQYDSTKTITTATITFLVQTARSVARYDEAQYDAAYYGFVLMDLMPVTIYDGRDGTTKLFEGQVYKIDETQVDDAEGLMLATATLLDYGAWLDRAVVTSTSMLVFPCGDADIIKALVAAFSPNIDTSNVKMVQAYIESYDCLGKTIRAVLDDLAKFSAAEWRIDFDARLYFNLPEDAPDAPFALSTSPDNVNSFQVRVDQYAKDFTNPVNHCYAAGKLDPTLGYAPAATYADPVSIQQYGEYDFAIIDDQIITANDAELRAKTTVLQYAYPVETGTFVIWKDGLALGQQVNLIEDALGINGTYIIRALTMQWVDQETVQYSATFGAKQPDLEAYLRLIDQIARWKTTKAGASIPIDGSVTDASIASGGLSASSINSVSAGTIVGLINAGQIGSVNSGAIIGQIQAGQIGSVNASSINGVISSSQIGSIDAAKITGSIQASQIGSVNATTITGSIQANQIQSVNAGAIAGSINAGQIGSINAGVIQGVVVSSQLADGIIDTLSKYATALQPIRIVKATTADPFPPVLPSKNFPPNSNFYNNGDGHFYQINAAGTSYTDQGTNPNTLTGSMEFYNIGAMNATDIIGLILAGQISSITAGQITGSIQAGQIQSITTGQITGTLNASQIASVNASSITGTIQSSQINTITAGQITGQISASQIASVNASTIQGAITAGQISTVNATAIQGVITAGQIASVNASTITGTITGSQIASVNAATITIGQLTDSQISNINASKVQVGGVNAGTITVNDGSGNVIGYIGNLQSGIWGAWFKVFGAGGTGYANANIYSDTSGNLFIRNSNFTVSGGGSTLSTSPTSFDPSYSSCAWVNSDGTNISYYVSRGLVIYSGGTKLGSVVRSPNGAYMEIECTVGGGYVLINGAAGVRSDAGYNIGGVAIINSSRQATLAFVTSSGGGFNITGSGSYQLNGAQSINFNNQFVGNGVDCQNRGGIGGTGFNYWDTGIGGYRSGQSNPSGGALATLTFYGGVITAFTSASDSRLKDRLGDFDFGLEAVLALKPHRWRWNASSQKKFDVNDDPQVGFFADEVAAIMPSAAYMGRGHDEGFYGYHKEGVVAALVNATKTLHERIINLEKEIDTWKNQKMN